MQTHHLRRDAIAVVGCGLLLLKSAGTVGAQPAEPVGATTEATSLGELKSRLQPGARLVLTDSAGREVGGELGAVSDTSLHLLSRGTSQIFTVADIALIKERRRDSLWNGFVIGAAAGAAPAVYWLITDPNECGGSICVDDLLVGVIPGAAIGLAIDAAIQKMVVVYRRPLSSTRTTLTVAPIMAEYRRGVAVSLLF